jgi:voltage-gated potassium channel
MIRKHHDFMWGFTMSLLASLKRPVFAYLSTLSFTLIAALASLFYWAESASNPQVQSFFDALYFSVTVMTGVGLGDLSPQTVLGRIVAMVMMLTGTAIFVCFAGALAASIMEIEMQHTKKEKDS